MLPKNTVQTVTLHNLLQMKNRTVASQQKKHTRDGLVKECLREGGTLEWAGQYKAFSATSESRSKSNWSRWPTGDRASTQEAVRKGHQLPVQQ